MNRFTRRLEALEARAPRREDALVLTKGMTDAECAAAYGRMLAGEPMESIFPGVEFEPDPEPNLIRDAVEGMTTRETSGQISTLSIASVRQKVSDMAKVRIPFK